MLKQRLATAAWGIPLLVASIWFGNPWYALLVAVITLMAAWEFYRLTNIQEKPLLFIGLIWALVLVLSPLFASSAALSLIVTGAVALPLLWQTLPSSKHNLSHSVWTIGGIFYVGWLLSRLIALRELPNGREWVFLALFTTFAFDTASYSVGRLLGRHHMTPAISPGKTWEGAAAGVVGAIIASLLLSLLFHLSIGPMHAVLLGLAVSIFAQGGDLVESVLKRNAKVKDSGSFLPGHGGMLDRIDSVAFAVPAVYYYVVWLLK